MSGQTKRITSLKLLTAAIWWSYAWKLEEERLFHIIMGVHCFCVVLLIWDFSFMCRIDLRKIEGVYVKCTWSQSFIDWIFFNLMGSTIYYIHWLPRNSLDFSPFYSSVLEFDQQQATAHQQKCGNKIKKIDWLSQNKNNNNKTWDASDYCNCSLMNLRTSKKKKKSAKMVIGQCTVPNKPFKI